MRAAFLILASTLPLVAATDYRSYFLDEFAKSRAHYFAKPDAYLDAGHLHHAACAAGAEVRAWQITRKPEHAASALARLKAIAGFLNQGQEASFFVPYPFTWAYRELDKAGLADAELRALARSGVSKAFRARDWTGIHNQILQRAAGLGLAAQTWPDLPEAKSWKEYAEAIERMQAQIEDVPENSTNYNAIDLVFTFLLADVTGHPELVRSKGIRAMYARFRDQISPGGFIAPYGDAGDFPQPFQRNWPILNPWGMYVTAFERAAAEYMDGTMAWAAHRVAESGMAHQPLDRSYTEIIDLFYFSFAIPSGVAETVPSSHSAVLTRSDFSGPSQPDKLILTPSREPGAPFLMADLYVRGPHAHENQHGAVVYFEYQNIPLITSLGYNNREPGEASLVMTRPAYDPFPSFPGNYPANEWRESVLPTSRLSVIDPAKPYLRRIDGLNVRIESAGVTAWVSDFRLVGNAVRTLDKGETTDGWKPEPAVDGHAIRWESPKGIQFHTKTVHAELDCREFPSLAFRWKLSDNRQIARPIILRVVTGEANTDYHAEAVQLEPTLVSARTEQGPGGQFGRMEYEGWMTPDTKLVRQMVLTDGGILAVLDRLMPGPLAKGMAAGPIWQMISNLAVRQGASWFYSSGGPMDLLTVLSGSSAGTTFGQQTSNVWSKMDQRTVFAKSLLVPGKPVYFMSVLVPAKPGTDAAALAKTVEIRNEEPGATVHIGGSVIMRIDHDGKWSVGR